METRQKKRSAVRLWRLCPLRHTLLSLSLLWTAVYFLTRGDRTWMNALCRDLVRPWHALAGRFYSLVRFSAAEWIIALWVVMGLCFIVQLVLHFRRRGGWEALWRWAVSLCTTVSVIFGLFCLWWGVYYYADSFTETSGLERREISAAELAAVTQHFADLANEYSPRVERDENGLFTADLSGLFDHSTELYRAVEAEVPGLAGPALRAKPAVFSRLMSMINNTGYFFCFTGEANVNVDCIMALLPATIAHELAHQRGVAREDEANFAGIVACLADGDAAFAYSGALMAYVYLGNALHDTDYELWEQVYASLNEDVHNDLRAHNAYWARYDDSKAAEITDRVYETVLKTYGDDRGMRSYDACVDLLAVWILDRS